MKQRKLREENAQNDFFSSQRAQAFEPFHLLLGAVFALAVLAIIVSAIGYFEGLKADVSSQKFYDGLAAAAKQPNNETLAVKNLQFAAKSAYSPKALAFHMGLNPDCVQIVDSHAPGFEFSGENVSTNDTEIADVFIRCAAKPDGFNSACEVSCQVSFARDFE